VISRARDLRVGVKERESIDVDRAMSSLETPRPRRKSRFTIALAAAVLALFGATASGAAAAGIEGVWSFNGGQIALQPEANGELVGIVVSPTKFATCTHPIGQKIWTGIKLQPDGSYYGLHQWYFETSPCTENPSLGPTAWRVVEEPAGSRYLMVCLSTPGTSQPTIAPGGPCVNATYGGARSALTAALTTSSVQSFKNVVSLPSGKKCLSGRRFKIHIHDKPYDPFKSVVVTRKGHKIKVVKKGSVYTATVNLRGLPRGAFTIKIKAVTVRGHHVSGSRTYRTCAHKSKPKSRSHH
jgi:hypothetical protein